jgi:hypothetical protein
VKRFIHSLLPDWAFPAVYFPTTPDAVVDIGYLWELHNQFRFMLSPPVLNWMKTLHSKSRGYSTKFNGCFKKEVFGVFPSSS